jgi:hypothetical protein
MSPDHSPARAPASPRYMTRRQLAEFLQGLGYPVTENMLNKLCAPSCGEGPKATARWGKKDLYVPEEGVEWAETMLEPVTA